MYIYIYDEDFEIVFGNVGKYVKTQEAVHPKCFGTHSHIYYLFVVKAFLNEYKKT